MLPARPLFFFVLSKVGVPPKFSGEAKGEEVPNPEVVGVVAGVDRENVGVVAVVAPEPKEKGEVVVDATAVPEGVVEEPQRGVVGAGVETMGVAACDGVVGAVEGVAEMGWSVIIGYSPGGNSLFFFCFSFLSASSKGLCVSEK